MGDDRARRRFEAMYELHLGRVLSYALARADRDVALDAVADAFLVAWRRLDDVPADALPWLLAVTRRTLAGQRRSSARGTALGERLRACIGVAPASTDPAEVVAERAVTVAALRTLPPGDQEVLCLVAWDGLSSTQAARSLGCSPATFLVRLHRARRRLAAALDRVDAVDPATPPATAPEGTR